MQLLFAFAFMAILLKSVKLHSGRLFAHFDYQLFLSAEVAKRWQIPISD